MNWNRRPFIEYLNAVDAVLERRGRTSTEAELAVIANCQEESITPACCAGILERKS